jgi:hypothetical protein
MKVSPKYGLHIYQNIRHRISEYFYFKALCWNTELFQCTHMSRSHLNPSHQAQIFYEHLALLCIFCFTNCIWSRNPKIGLRGSVALTTQHPLLQKLALTSPTRCGRSLGIVYSRTKVVELVSFTNSKSLIWSHPYVSQNSGDTSNLIAIFNF